MKKIASILAVVLLLTTVFSQAVFADGELVENELMVCFNRDGTTTQVVDVIGGGMWDNQGNPVTVEDDAAVIYDSTTGLLTLKNYSYSGTGYSPEESSNAYGIYGKKSGTQNVKIVGECTLSVLRTDEMTTYGMCYEPDDPSYGLFINGENSKLNVNVTGTNSCAFSCDNVIINSLETNVNVEAVENGYGFDEGTCVYIQAGTVLTSQAETATVPITSQLFYKDYGHYQKVLAGENADTAEKLLIPAYCTGYPYLHIEPMEDEPKVLVCFTDSEGGTDPYFLDVIKGGSWDNYGNEVADSTQANVVYDAATATLTLRNYVYESVGLPIVNKEGLEVLCTGIYVDNDKTSTMIITEGSCSLKVYNNGLGSCKVSGIFCPTYGGLVFTGYSSSKLSVWADGGAVETVGIDAGKDIIFNAGAQGHTPNYNISCASEGLQYGKNSYGIVTHSGDIEIKNSNLTAEAGTAHYISAGIRVGSEEGYLLIECSDVEARAGVADGSVGILGSAEDPRITPETNKNNITIVDSQVIAEGGQGTTSNRGINNTGNIVISGEKCEVFAYGKESGDSRFSDGICTDGSISIENKAHVFASGVTGCGIVFNTNPVITLGNYGCIPVAYAGEDGANVKMLDDPTTCGTVSGTGTYKVVEIMPAVMLCDVETYTLGSKKTVTFRADVALNAFAGVSVDGKALTSNDYSVSQGSTVITLKPDYLEKLVAGYHTVTATWNISFAGTGTLEESFEVVNGSTTNTTKTNVNTGDRNNMSLWIILLLVAVAVAAVGIGVYVKKRKC